MDPFDLYEHCVQSPAHVVKFLLAAHGQLPVVLREDFCGSAAVSRRWAAEGHKRGDDARALGIDLSAAAIGAARARLDGALSRRVRLEAGDCVGGSVPCADEGADVVFVGNYSLGYIFDRRTLVAYMRASRERLARGNGGFGGGIFVCDTYGGAGAFKLGAIQRKHSGPRGEIIHYLWRHDRADPMTSIVENSMSFRVERDGEIVAEYTDAFTYRWRLWSIAELREAMAEAGFASSEVHVEINLAPEEELRPVSDPAELGESWSV
ncbi:MAG: methyltransferase domain-containing protein, partial [Phycisphaerales bacterium]